MTIIEDKIGIPLSVNNSILEKCTDNFNISVASTFLMTTI